MKISTKAVQEVEEALELYKRVVKAANLAENTEKTYVLHSENFVRWLKDDFEPGRRLK